MLRLLLLSLVFSTASCVLAQRPYLPTDSLTVLADEVYDLVRQRHASAYLAEGRQRLARARTQVQSRLREVPAGDSLPLTEVTRLLLPLQEATGCGHLILRPYQDSLSKARTYENYFDLRMARVGETYVLRRGLQQGTDSLPPGHPVLRVNGEAVEDVLHGIATFQGFNDYGNHAIARAVYAKIFSSQYQKFYGMQDSLVLGLPQGKQFVLYPEPRTYNPGTRDTANVADLLKFEVLDDGRTALLGIRSFKSRHYRDGNYFQFVREVIDSLQRTAVERLVVDLRGNTGGNSKQIIYLYNRLTQAPFYFAREAVTHADTVRSRRWQRRMGRQLTRPRKPLRKPSRRFDGELVVLVDEMSYSASGMFAQFVQGSGRGRVVGRPTGASAGVVYSGTGRTRPTRVGPGGKLELLINDVQLIQAAGRPTTVVPDTIIPLTAADLASGRDAIMEYVRKD